jgi:P27 family predicted phage terminase small subunit
MTKGRKPKPTALKVLEGTARKDRILKNEMQPARLDGLPLAPDFLTERGREEWHYLCTELHALGMLHRVDLSLIGAYCNELSIYFEAEAILRAKGRIMTLKNPDGTIKYIQQAPHVAIARNALKTAMQLGSQFGVTPSARTRISQGQIKTDVDDAWDSF